MNPPPRDVWIIGAGRMGLALGGELLECGWAGRLRVISRRPEPPHHPLFALREVTYSTGLPPEPLPSAVFIAVSDAGISDVVSALEPPFASSQSSPGSTVVLHTSGVLGSDVLAPLALHGAAVASLHPLVSIADSQRDASRLRGAWYGIEGDPRGAAVAAEVVGALGGRALEVQSGEKALYHAAAVFTSNFLVSVMSVGERLMAEAGVDGESARAALIALAAGTLDNVASVGPAQALTGPVSRGDAATVERHLRRLSVEDRLLYSGLAREALHLAVTRELPPEAAQRISALIRSELP